jgi:hypothetical protein
MLFYWGDFMRRLCFSLLLCGICATQVAAQMLNFKPFTSFRVIQTQYFEIIFPEASAQTAQSVADFADRVYERVSALLGIQLKQKVPVAITPHTEQFNSYMRRATSPHILLFDTPTDPDQFTTFENALESVFLHELTHAVSLSSHNSTFQLLYDIFGGWFDLIQFTAPMFMVEGVAVAFESLDGFGRANDPLTKQVLRQAVIEDKFLTPFQASGVYEYPPSGAWYQYGGLFSAWLIEQYGMEKYAELWRLMGGDYHLSFFFYNNGYFHSFKKVYDVAFLDAWKSFQDSLRLDRVEDNSANIVRDGQSVIPAMAVGGGRVFALDNVAGAVVAFEPAAARSRDVVAVDYSSYDLDVSADGSRALVSSYRYAEDLAAAIVTEYNTSNGRKTGRAWHGLYQGHYFRDGVVGLSSSRHLNNLVYRAGATEEVLLMGSDTLVLGSPRALNDTWVAFIAARSGVRELCLYNYETRDTYTLSSDADHDADHWRYLRFLQASEGRLLFGFNHDDRFYKLGSIDLRGLRNEPVSDTPAFSVVFSSRDFSGGVALPVLLGDAVYYRASFANWDALARFPETSDALSGNYAALSFTRWDVTPAPAVCGTLSLPTTRYNPLAYMNPFDFWLPVPLVSVTADGAISFDGGGIMSIMMDPTDTNLISLAAYMNARQLMADFNIQWTTLALGFPLTLAVSDTFDMTRLNPYRRTFAGLEAAWNRGLWNESNRVFFSLGANVSLIAFNPSDDSHVYEWDYEAPVYSINAGLGFSSLRRFQWQLFGNGVALNTAVRYTLPRKTLGGEERFTAGLETKPVSLKFSLYHAWSAAADLDLWGRTINHENNYIGGTLFSDIASTEYPTKYITRLSWLAGGEAELKLFALDIQKSLGHLYYNRVFTTLAYRGVFYNAAENTFQRGVAPQGTALTPLLLPAADYYLAQSLVLRLGLTVSSVIKTDLPLRFTPSLWGAWKLSNLPYNELTDDFTLGLGFSMTL